VPIRLVLGEDLDRLERQAGVADVANGSDSAVALRRHQLFNSWLRNPDTNDSGLSAEELFYNSYFWFIRYTTTEVLLHGPNSGLEQQAFQMLEYSPVDVDWEALEKIDSLATHPE